jgi:hypothetical protein
LTFFTTEGSLDLHPVYIMPLTKTSCADLTKPKVEPPVHSTVRPATVTSWPVIGCEAVKWIGYGPWKQGNALPLQAADADDDAAAASANTAAKARPNSFTCFIVLNYSFVLGGIG